MPEELDVVVVGAGLSGLHALHLLREQGLRVRAYDEAGNVGGCWWWHAYPGSHLDTASHLYQYFFSEALYRDWGWSERYPAGYEVQRWLRFVADRLDLRRDIRLSTRVLSARWEGEKWGEGCWTVRTDRGETVRARHLVCCTGRRPVEPDVDVADFAGLLLRTAAWAEDGHDLAGRRVGILGTTVATIQLAPTVADTVAHLTVVSDGPRDVVPRRNPLYGWQEREAYKARFAELSDSPPAVEPLAPDRDAMRARLADERLAALLVPDDGDARDGADGRVTLDAGWLELFARDDVALLPLTELARVRAEGLELADGTVVALDVLVVADDPDDGPPADLDGPTADAPGLHRIVAPPGGGTVSFDLARRVEAVVAEIGGGG